MENHTLVKIDSCSEFDATVTLSGSLKIRKPVDMTAAEAEKVAFHIIKEALQERMYNTNRSVGCSINEARVWGQSGGVRIGNVFFDQQHDVKKQISCSTLNIQPKKGKFGDTRQRAQVKTYVTPHCASISAIDPQSNNEVQLVTVAFNGPDLAVYVNETKNNQCDSNESIQLLVSTKGLVSPTH